MAAVDIGIRHQDDLVVAALADVEVFPANAGAESRNQRTDLGRAQDLVEACPLDVEDLAPKRQDCLVGTVARLLRRAAGRIPLDDEQLAAGRVALLAIGELAGQRGDVESTLAPRQFACLAGRLARCRRFDDLAQDLLGFGRVLLEPAVELLADDRLNDRAHLRGNELLLGLRGEFRVRHLDRKHARQAFAGVVAGDRDLVLFRPQGRVGLDRARQRAAESGQMGTSVPLRDVVGKAQHRFVEAVIPLHRRLDHQPVLFAADHDRCGEHRRLGAVKIGDEGLQTAFVEEIELPWLNGAGIDQPHPHAGIEKSELAQAVFDGGVIELGHRKDVRRRKERQLRSRLRRSLGHGGGVADDGQRRFRIAVAEAHEVVMPIPSDAQLQPFRERVDDRDTDAVQTARDLVRIAVELAAGMQPGHDHFCRRNPFLLVQIDRNTAAVIGHGHRAIGVKLDDDLRAVASERFVDRVVDGLVDHMVQARAVIGVADVHPRPLAHGFEATQHLDRGGVVNIPCRRGRFAHEVRITPFKPPLRSRVPAPRRQR